MARPTALITYIVGIVLRIFLFLLGFDTICILYELNRSVFEIELMS